MIRPNICPQGRVMKRLKILFPVLCACVLAACGSYNSMSNSNQMPVLSGSWNVTFAPSGSGGTAPPSTALTVMFNQNGSNVSGTVTAVNNPSGSCFPAISPTGTTFTVTGQVSSATSSNLNFNVAFMSGSTSGTISATGATTYLSTTASGTFMFATGTSGCTSGTFSMTKVG